MKIITINLPDKYLDAIQVLIENGMLPSRSQGIRNALQEFLADELKLNSRLDTESFKMILRSRLR